MCIHPLSELCCDSHGSMCCDCSQLCDALNEITSAYYWYYPSKFLWKETPTKQTSKGTADQCVLRKVCIYIMKRRLGLLCFSIQSILCYCSGCCEWLLLLLASAHKVLVFLLTAIKERVLLLLQYYYCCCCCCCCCWSVLVEQSFKCA